jgi:hypothetical protein
MSIQSCQVAPSSERSHFAVMLPLSGAHPERGPHRSARLGRGWSRYSGDVAATDEGPHTVLVNPGMQDRDFTLVVIGAACELISSRVVFDELDRLDSLIANHDVDVVDKEEAAREPFVNVGSGDRDRNLANDVALGPPSATSAPSGNTGRPICLERPRRFVGEVQRQLQSLTYSPRATVIIGSSLLCARRRERGPGSTKTPAGSGAQTDEPVWSRRSTRPAPRWTATRTGHRPWRRWCDRPA